MQADIVIVGAGMVGSLLAASLQHLSLNIVMIDQIHATEPNNQAPYEPRVSALTRASQNMLTHVGAWQLVKQKRYAPFSTMQVREQEGHGELLFSAFDVGVSHLGCLVENNLLQWALTECAVQGGVKLIVPDKVVALERLTQQWQVTLASGTVIATPLVVGADGAFSAIRQLVGIGVDTWDYQQKAIVCTVKTQQPHQDCARQVFLSSGPLAFLPLPDAHYCSIVWSAKNEEAARILALSDDDFKAQLSRHFAQELGTVEWCDTRYAFPLIARHAQRYFLKGLTLVGDAAHTIHPLAGQGVNLGWRDVAELADLLEYAQNTGQDYGANFLLERYRKKRHIDQQGLYFFTDGLTRLCGIDSSMVSFIRQTGLGVVNKIPPLKRFFMKKAMGI